MHRPRSSGTGCLPHAEGVERQLGRDPLILERRGGDSVTAGCDPVRKAQIAGRTGDGCADRVVRLARTAAGDRCVHRGVRAPARRGAEQVAHRRKQNLRGPTISVEKEAVSSRNRSRHGSSAPSAPRMMPTKSSDIGYNDTCAPKNIFTSLRWNYPDQLKGPRTCALHLSPGTTELPCIVFSARGFPATIQAPLPSA